MILFVCKILHVCYLHGFFCKYMNVYTLFQCIKFTAFLCNYKFHNMFKKKFHRYQINFPTCIQIKKDFIEILKYLSLTFELT